MDSTSAAPRKKNRRAFIDLARGFAVLCMIEHHSFDAFMPDSFHGSELDHFFRFMGGVAAPAFLFLAGVAMVMMMEGGVARGLTIRASAWAAAKRGWWVFLGAYLFRFQEWALAFGASPAWTMLRIDVLNCIGVALMLTALVWALGRTLRKRAICFGLACAAVVLAAPIIWDHDFPGMPQLLFDYVRGSPPRALFPLFPWIGFSFAGALLGLHLSAARTAKHPERAEREVLAIWVAIATPLWFVLTDIPYFDGLSYRIYPHMEWWRTSPVYFILRCISMIWMLGAAFVLEQAWQPVRDHFRWKRPGPIVAMGQHSLVIYWVHIEIVYGRLTWGVRGKLTLTEALLTLFALYAAMAALSYVIDPAIALAKSLPARFSQSPPAGRLRAPRPKSQSPI